MSIRTEVIARAVANGCLPWVPQDCQYACEREFVQDMSNALGVTLSDEAIGGTDDRPTVDGMDAWEWLDAMTMD